MGIFSRFFKDQSVPDTPSEREKAWSTDSFFATSQRMEQYNPDQLVAQKGADIYRKMLRDPQVKAAFNLIIDIIVSRKFRFEPVNDSPKQLEIAKFFEWTVNDFLHSTFRQAMRGILMAKAHGFSISEKVYASTTWEGKNVWTVKAIKNKPFDSFQIEHDVFGNIKKLVQNQDNKKVRLDPAKFIYFVTAPELDPIWGEPDLRAAYRSWWEKQNILTFWNIYLERTAGGFLTATPKDQSVVLSPAEKNDFDAVLRNVNQSTAMRVPAGFEVDVKNGLSTRAFEEAIQHRDKQIAKSLLVPNLLGFSESDATGSFAQAKVHLDTFMFVVNYQGDLLADALNEQLFRELSIWNFGVEEPPRFKFDIFTDTQKQEIVNMWTLAFEKGVVRTTDEDEKRIRKLLDFPDLGVGKELPKDEAPPVDKGGGEKRKNDFDKSRGFAEDKQPWSKRVDFGGLNELMESNDAAFTRDMQESMLNLKDNILRKLESVDPGSTPLDKLSATLSRFDTTPAKGDKNALNKVVKKHLKISYNDGRAFGQDLLNESLKNSPEKIRERVSMSIACARKDSVTDEEWSVLDFVEGVKKKNSENYFTTKSFGMVKGILDRVKNSLNETVTKAVTNSWAMREVISTIEQQFKKFNQQIDSIVTTAMVDAFTQAGLAVYTDSEIGNYVTGFEYSAVLDHRTTLFCRSYDGFIRPIEDPVWGSISPPNHFNSLAEGTLITTDKGQRPIETIRPGDLVKTHKGRMKRVYDVMAKKPDTKTFKKLNLSTGRSLFITDEHPVLTTSGWEHTRDLKIGDVLFHDVKDVSGVSDNILLADPENYPFTLDEVSTPYDISFASSRAPVTLTVDLNNESVVGESKVTDDMVNNELGFITKTTGIKPVSKETLVPCGVRPKVSSKGYVSFLKDVFIMNGIRLKHSLRVAFVDIRRFFSEAVSPVIGTRRLVEFVGDTDLCFSGADGNTVSFAPPIKTVVTPTKAPLDASDGFTVGPVTSFNKFFNFGSVSEVHKTSPDKVDVDWKLASIISIVEVECNTNLWNLAVEEDETYLAEDVVVHNCRSVLLPITITDGKFNSTTKLPSNDEGLLQPKEGFGIVSK